MEQTKALNALEPFLALSKSANSPRAAADLVSRATSAPNTYIFAELLQKPQIRALASAAGYSPHLELLRIFSYGTYQNYQAAAESLPPLSDAQTTKLRQLTLISLVTVRANLTYDSLQASLGLTSARDVENLVISAIYAGLLDATLDPARQVVQVIRVAPLRDPCPGAIPALSDALKTWAGRCTSTLENLEGQIRNIRTTAAARERQNMSEKDKLQSMINEFLESPVEKKRDTMVASMSTMNRSVKQPGKPSGSHLMDLDESSQQIAAKLRAASKRKM